nr:glycosyltransferase family 4 protein [Halapricum sp. CBA1109]
MAEYCLARDGVYPRRRLPYLWATSRLERWFYGRLRATVPEGPTYTVVSPQLRSEVSTFGVEDAAYVPNGLSTPAGESVGPIRERFDIPDHATLLVSLGSHTYQKRPALCARCLDAVCAADPSIHAVIAGDGPLHDDVVSAVSSDRVHVRGYVDDDEKWRWLATADAFVSLSAYEGMPVASLEALSFGVPVVLSDVPAHRSLVERHACGALIEPTPDALGTAVDRVAGVDVSASLPSWESVASTYLAVADSED